MQLPLFPSKDQAMNLLQTKWRSILNPLIANLFTQGQALTSVVLTNGTNVVNHKLGRLQQGWVIADQNAVADIYRSQPFNDTTLTLHSSAVVTVNLWVF